MRNIFGHLNFGKMEKGQNLKNGIFDSPLIVNQTFSQTGFIIGKSDFAHIMNFLNQISDICEV